MPHVSCAREPPRSHLQGVLVNHCSSLDAAASHEGSWWFNQSTTSSAESNTLLHVMYDLIL